MKTQNSQIVTLSQTLDIIYWSVAVSFTIEALIN